jgi:hypothetical protein
LALFTHLWVVSIPFKTKAERDVFKKKKQYRQLNFLAPKRTLAIPYRQKKRKFYNVR